MSVTDVINLIDTKEDFILFIELLQKDFTINNKDWKNKNINEYLSSLVSWVEDFSNCPQNDVDWSKVEWKVIARIFYMGKIYE